MVESIKHELVYEFLYRTLASIQGSDVLKHLRNLTRPFTACPHEVETHI